jgi:hypothetical protein
MISGCASQPGANQSAAGAQVVSAAGQSCELDVKRVCQELKDRPVIDSATGQTQDRTEREQNASRTDSRFVSYPIPNGSVVEVQCDINTEHNSVVYAHLMPGPPLTPTDLAFIQKNGYCVH